MAESDWDGGDGERIVLTERMFDLSKKDGGGNMINDDCDKYDDDNCDDDCRENTSCKISVIDFENLMFLFSIRWRWSL